MCARSVEKYFTYGELEALLHEERELANAATLLAEHGLRARRAKDDLGAHRRHAHLEAGVAVLAEVALHHLVQLGLEDTVGDELVSDCGGGGAMRTEQRARTSVTNDEAVPTR